MKAIGECGEFFEYRFEYSFGMHWFSLERMLNLMQGLNSI